MFFENTWGILISKGYNFSGSFALLVNRNVPIYCYLCLKTLFVLNSNATSYICQGNCINIANINFYVLKKTCSNFLLWDKLNNLLHWLSNPEKDQVSSFVTPKGWVLTFKNSKLGFHVLLILLCGSWKKRVRHAAKVQMYSKWRESIPH